MAVYTLRISYTKDDPIVTDPVVTTEEIEVEMIPDEAGGIEVEVAKFGQSWCYGRGVTLVGITASDLSDSPVADAVTDPEV